MLAMSWVLRLRSSWLYSLSSESFSSGRSLRIRGRELLPWLGRLLCWPLSSSWVQLRWSERSLCSWSRSVSSISGLHGDSLDKVLLVRLNGGDGASGVCRRRAPVLRPDVVEVAGLFLDGLFVSLLQLGFELSLLLLLAHADLVLPLLTLLLDKALPASLLLLSLSPEPFLGRIVSLPWARLGWHSPDEAGPFFLDLVMVAGERTDGSSAAAEGMLLHRGDKVVFLEEAGLNCKD